MGGRRAISFKVKYVTGKVLREFEDVKRSSLGLDLYMWLVYRTFNLREPVTLRWRDLYRQFGAHPSKAGDKATVAHFCEDCLRELKKTKMAWEGFDYGLVRGALVLLPTLPSVPPMIRPVGRKDNKSFVDCADLRDTEQ